MNRPAGRRGIVFASGTAGLLLLGLAGLVSTGVVDRPAASVAVAPTGKAASVRPDAEPVGLAEARLPSGPPITERKGFSILQIGDSHTAADLFTGTVRQILQDKYGRGGVGYVHVGTPHPGVRSALLRPTASAGWTYENIRRSAQPDRFGLSGFNARTSLEGETLSFASETPVPFTVIGIELRTGPEAGSVEIEIDDVPVRTALLATGAEGRRIIEVAAPGGSGAFRRMAIRTTEAKPVAVSAIGVFRRGSGLTYSSVGYPGATIELLARHARRVFAEDLSWLAPDLVVLAFGTNEGFDAHLEPGAYRERYRSAIQDIRRALPRARLVMIGPPQGERAPPACKPVPGRACRAPATESGSVVERADACSRRPPQLDQVREVQRRLAEAERIPFWDWWASMPAGCGASRWAAEDPPLMGKDRVHFTRLGYGRSAAAFAAFIDPEIKTLLGGGNVVSNH